MSQKILLDFQMVYLPTLECGVVGSNPTQVVCLEFCRTQWVLSIQCLPHIGVSEKPKVLSRSPHYLAWHMFA